MKRIFSYLENVSRVRKDTYRESVYIIKTLRERAAL